MAVELRDSRPLVEPDDMVLSPADVERIRRQFPAIASNPGLIFFDNAATSQRPAAVIERIESFYRKECSNAGRSIYSRSTRLTKEMDRTRQHLAHFINASAEDVAFTSGSTDSLNQVASNWGLHNLTDGDEVLVCLEDHHSAVFPWLNLKDTLARFGIHIKVVPFDIHPTGAYDWKDLQSKLSDRTRLLALSHVHHLFGMEMDLEEILAGIPDDVLVSLDASQSIGHTPIDVTTLGVHFVSVSGHKMLAGNGVGGLWVAPDVRRQMRPTRVGAKSSVRFENNDWSVSNENLAGLVECGTLNIPSILSIEPALDFIESVGLSRIEAHVSSLTSYLYNLLKGMPGIEFAPGPGVCGCTKGYGIISFRFTGFDSADLASYLDSEGILVRAGNHCLGSTEESYDFIRVSMHLYNTTEEIETLVEVLEDATG